MKDLIGQNLIERVGEYNSANPIYKGLMVKQTTEENTGNQKKQKQSKKDKRLAREAEAAAAAEDKD